MALLLLLLHFAEPETKSGSSIGRYAERIQEDSERALRPRLNAKYEPEAEREVIGWINALVPGANIQPGRENLMESVLNQTPSLTPEAQRIRRPIVYSTMSAPFKQMENIEVFLNCAMAYGVPKASLFQTVDLYEGRNMAQVLNTLLQLGTECQRHGMRGPVCGPRPTYKNARQFTAEQLRSSEGIISLQAGTNKCASQKGMSMGGQRHIADIRCDEMTPEGNARHIADIRCDNMTPEGSAVIGLQMGTNKCASQAGMSIGGQRHIADIRCDQMTPEGSAVIGLQMGLGQKQGANQSGMSFGGIRHIADGRVSEGSKEGASVIGLQMGPGQGQVASQSGMTFGGQRHILDSH
uniref:Transgelin n=1 Tax=Macrostomum lignano TaxID=282301 RepID=A0A1I8G1L6_9PLAT